ncbi:MAG: metallophosphoesterase [Gallionella sp.]|nr:metallophosphoesterase [Gallionella sp.]
MLAFLSVAFLIYGVMHIYALAKVWLVFTHSPGPGLTLGFLGLVMTFSPLILWHMTKQNWHGATVVTSWAVYVWMGFLFLFCSIALVFDAGHAMAVLLGFKWHLNESKTLLTVGLLALSMLGYGFVEARKIRVEKIKITTPRLSQAIGRVTIAQISDLHLGVMLGDEFLERVIAILREIQPDIIVATGDIIDGQGDDLDALARRFLTLQPPKGKFAVLGNHEYYAGLDNSLRFLHSAGFTVLRGESAAAGGIIVAGIDDPGAGATKADRALASVTKEDFIVLLKHQPVFDSEMPFDLQLSGHIHGGQIFPFGILTRLSYGVRTGLTQLADGRLLYVSRGAGTWGPPIRLFAAPEITLVTIESEKK